MLEPPSQELVRQLTELQLCRPGDLRRARGRVRRLSFDLPAFDSVWIDSLVQLRSLTPYQARQLEDGFGERLRIGSFVVVDELGHSERGMTLLARRIHRRDRCVVKRLRIEPERVSEVTQKMQFVLERSKGFAHPQLALPNEIIPMTSHELVTVSRFVPGLPLNELLVRRGRFPASVVLEIARQLLDGLSALNALSLVHGDIRMSNVRLTDTGLAVLVDGAIRLVIHSEVTIHDTLTLEAYDGLAPELIGTGAAASASSELYALGCLLWQLLAGRPPFAMADPLAKIAAHQTRTIDDVRILAPDTPAILAETIRQMTSPDSQQRPRSFDEVLQRLGKPGSFSRSRLRQFRRLFDGAVPHFSGPPVKDGLSNWVWLAAVMFAVTGGVALLCDNKLRFELLEIVQKFKTAARTQRDIELLKHAAKRDDVAAENRSRGLLPLPAPSADGVILLTEHGPYAATTLTFQGHLTIRGANGVKPEIQVGEWPLVLTAQSVSLVQITVTSTKTNEPGFLAKIQCQQLNVVNCDFLVATPDLITAEEFVFMAWKPSDRNSKSGQILVKNSVFHGLGTAILLAQSPRRIQLSNSLKVGLGAFVSLGPRCQATDLKLELDHVTLRQTGPLLRLDGEFASKTGALPLQVEADESVFKLAEPQSGLIVIDSERHRSDAAKCIELKAKESVVAPGTTLLATFDTERNKFSEVEADEQFDGLIAGEIKFSGERLDRTDDAKTAAIKGPRTAANVELPGIDPRQIGPSNRAVELQK